MSTLADMLRTAPKTPTVRTRLGMVTGTVGARLVVALDNAEPGHNAVQARTVGDPAAVDDRVLILFTSSGVFALGPIGD